jgi:hypothetical protein
MIKRGDNMDNKKETRPEKTKEIAKRKMKDSVFSDLFKN